jgi:uncharacterized protein GlcG (DUF336 family)
MKMPIESRSRSTLTDNGARRIVDSAIAEAQSMGVPVTVVVVDDAGNLKAMRRMDGAPLVSIQTAQNKAYAAAAIGKPVDDFFEAIRGDAAAVASFASRPGLALIAGGVPVVDEGQVLGGVGVAGAMTGAEDRRIAESGARPKDAANLDTKKAEGR